MTQNGTKIKRILLYLLADGSKGEQAAAGVGVVLWHPLCRLHLAGVPDALQTGSSGVLVGFNHPLHWTVHAFTSRQKTEAV